MFKLQSVNDGVFRGVLESPFDGRVFGGDLLARALSAAMLVEHDDRVAHSMHANFLRAGKLGEAIEYRVRTMFDGRSFATRQIDAVQDGSHLLAMTVSFHRAETGPEHQSAGDLDGDPETALTAFQNWRRSRVAAGLADPARRFDQRPIMIVPLDADRAYSIQPNPPRARSWIKCRTGIDRNSPLQRALLAYASDMMLLRVSMQPHGIRPGMPNVQSASLDHALWIHEAPDLNDWHMFETESNWSRNARAMNHGRIYDRSGVLVAEVAQESLVRRL